jgi:hypothetical protein
MIDQVLSADQTPVFTRPAQEITRRIEPVQGQPLTFRTRDLARPGDVTLVPFYQLHDERYAVYWRLAKTDD